MANEPLQYGRYYHIYNCGNHGILFESPFGRKIVDNERYLMTLKPTKVNRDEVLAWYDNRSHFAAAHAVEPDMRLIAPLLMERIGFRMVRRD